MANKSTSLNKATAMPSADIDYRAQGDCCTLESAEEIRSDKKRLKAAKKHAAAKAKSLAKIAGK